MEISTGLCALRALRLLDPVLSGWANSEEDEKVWLSRAILGHADVDTPRIADELVKQVLYEDEDPIGGLFQLARQFIEFRNGTPKCNHPSVWYRICHDLDIDMLVAARLALSHPLGPESPEVTAMAWPSVLSPEGFSTELILSRELVDSHVHLGGALPSSFYWVAMMNEFIPLRRLNDPELWGEKVQKALLSRQFFFEDLFTCNFSRLSADWGGVDWAQDLPTEPFVDYFLRRLVPSKAKRSKLNPVLGERFLLWKGLSQLITSETREKAQAQGEEAALNRSSLTTYLRTRNSLIRHLNLLPSARGLDNFLTIFSRRGILFSKKRNRGSNRSARCQQRAGLALEQFRVRHALRYQFSDPADAPWARDHGIMLGDHDMEASSWRPARQLELRVSPVLNSMQNRVIHAQLMGLSDFLKYDKDAPAVRMGLIFHVLRSNDELARSMAKSQIEGLLCLLEGHPRLRPFIIGIDAAGAELNMPPRDLAECYQLVQDYSKQQRVRPGEPPITLGRTCHAGEDFRDILTGLRYVDDVVSLLKLGPGERIGHGLALAMEPADFYQSRQTVYPLRQDHILDLIWALHLAQLNEAPLCMEPDALLIATINALLETHLQTPAMERVHQASKDFENIKQFPREADFFSFLGIPMDSQPTAVAINPAYIRMVDGIRERVVKRVSRAEVVIEVCPTSNLLIGCVAHYQNLPYLNLNRAGMPGEADVAYPIQFSINSDDPGIFQTTIANEFRILARALIEHGGHRQRDVLKWLEEARQVGLSSSFIPAWNPPTKKEILYCLHHLDRD